MRTAVVVVIVGLALVGAVLAGVLMAPHIRGEAAKVAAEQPTELFTRPPETPEPEPSDFPSGWHEYPPVTWTITFHDRVPAREFIGNSLDTRSMIVVAGTVTAESGAAVTISRDSIGLYDSRGVGWCFDQAATDGAEARYGGTALPTTLEPGESVPFVFAFTDNMLDAGMGSLHIEADDGRVHCGA